MKHLYLILFCLLPVFALAQVQKVAILETVDKEGNIPYGIKLMLRSNLAKAITNAPGFEAYDRTDMNAIMGEQNFQRTGMVSDDQIKRLGEMTGAAYILVAEAVKVDEVTMFITAKILNVETAKTEMTDNALMGTSPSDIQHGCESLANKLLGISSASVSPTPAQKQAARTKVQNVPNVQPSVPQQQLVQAAPSADGIGELYTFPDGTQGIVFYKTADGHGLAVSLDETTLKWEDVKRSRDCHDIAMLPNEDGVKMMTFRFGLQNTNYILQQIGSTASAALWCTRHGDGWYLPSAGELYYLLAEANGAGINSMTAAVVRAINANIPVPNRISTALIMAGGTGLSGGWYWSSTENDVDEAINVSSKGSMASEDKTEALRVRAIRDF